MPFLRHSLFGQVIASLIVAAVWIIGTQTVAVVPEFGGMFAVAIFLGSLAIFSASVVLTGEKASALPALVLVVSMGLAVTLHQLGILLAGAGLYAAYARARYVYERTSAWTPFLVTFFVSFPVAVLYVLFEPTAYGALKDWGLHGLAERQALVAVLPSVALLVLQTLVVVGRKHQVAA